MIKSVQVEFSVLLWKKESSFSLQNGGTLESCKALMRSAQPYELTLKGMNSEFTSSSLLLSLSRSICWRHFCFFLISNPENYLHE